MTSNQKSKSVNRCVAYLLEKQSVKFHPNLILSDTALGFFEEWHHKREQQYDQFP